MEMVATCWFVYLPEERDVQWNLVEELLTTGDSEPLTEACKNIENPRPDRPIINRCKSEIQLFLCAQISGTAL
jgi:hypothetical protein